jgi:hypothetical protein
MKLQLIQVPENYMSLLEMDVSDQFCQPGEQPDLVHLFARTEKQFIEEINAVKKLVHPKIIIWVSWLKKASGITTDLNEEMIRQWALKNNLVDVKVCAVSDIWSGLKLVVPLRKR